MSHRSLGCGDDGRAARTSRVVRSVSPAAWLNLLLMLVAARPALGLQHDRSVDSVSQALDAAAFRTGWGADDLLVAFRGGDNAAPHSHLDLGTFVLDALGVRWALDLGEDEGDLPGYAEVGDAATAGRRWSYYRTRPEGHNTLVLNHDAGPGQDPNAAAEIVRWASEPDRAFAIVDLTAAYAEDAVRVRRGVMLLRDRPAVIVQDEVQAHLPSVYWWFMHTCADVAFSPDRRTATLTQDGQRLVVKILSPLGRFDVFDARPLPTSPDPPGQSPNAGVRKLVINLGDLVDDRIVVALMPAGAAAVPLPEPLPLDRW